MHNKIKVCPDPHCEAVYHNCPKNYTRCLDCGGWIMAIQEKTYWAKFSMNWFQYDAISGNIYRPNGKQNNVDQSQTL